MLPTAHTRRYKPTGFTLIELLIVVGIVALITGGIVPAFSNYMRDQDLLQAQEQLKNDLRSIQNRALTGALSEAQVGVGGNNVRFWGVQFSPSSATPGTFKYFVTDDNSNCPPTNSSEQGSYALPNNMVIRTSTLDVGTDGCMFFDFATGGITISSEMREGAYTPIILGIAGETECRRVRFNNAGLIRMSTDDGC